jgi:hypothetical protein
LTKGDFCASIWLVSNGGFVLSTNNAQARKLDFLLTQSILPDAAGDRWRIKQQYMVPHPTIQGECVTIVLVLVDKTGFIMFYYIRYDGNHDRRVLLA